jgi:hypothetical protein
MDTYRTNDMALAAYLNMHGHMHQRMEKRNGRECVWVFYQSEPLRRLCEGFLGGNAQVEPKRYLQEVSAVRKEMYNFLDQHQQ